jgi:hypothetical protein
MFKIILRKLFPNAIPKFHIAKSNIGVINNKESEEKTVLLLGWLGSNSRNLKKVIEYYSSRGINTISFIMPLGIPECFRKSIENDLCNGKIIKLFNYFQFNIISFFY